MKRFLIGFLLIPCSLLAQIGGSSIYEFVDLPYSAMENVHGGALLTGVEKNLGTALKNPSILDSTYNGEMIGSWGLLHLRESGIGSGTIGYAIALSNNITMSAGIHFINYGKFSGYDEYGNSIEPFFPSEYLLICGASWPLTDNVTIGASIKPLVSYFQPYTSWGLLFDASATYVLSNSCFSLVARNCGWQIKSYTGGEHEPIPFSIDLGYSLALSHAPICFNFTYGDLQKFNIYENDSDDERKFVEVGKNFLMHVAFSTEIHIGKIIKIYGGYNYRKAESLSFGSSNYGAGLCVGFGLNFSRFSVAYGWAKQQAAGGRNFFTFACNVESLYSICKTSFQNRKIQKQ